jgi:hypothetical protein
MSKERREFARLCLTALGQSVKGTEWKKSSNFVYRTANEFFLTATLSVYLNADVTRATFMAKPIAVDPILWEILNMRENAQEPLSFRANGAFTCPMPEFMSGQLEPPTTTPSAIASAFLEFARRSSIAFFEGLNVVPFLRQVEQHPNQRERGAYAITLVTDHINGGNVAEALRVAKSYAEGHLHSCAQMSDRGRSFHDLAVEWLSSKHAAA